MSLQLHHASFFCLFDEFGVEFLGLEFKGDVHSASDAGVDDEVDFVFGGGGFEEGVEEGCLALVG